MDEIKQFIKSSENPQELHNFAVLLYDNFILDDDQNKIIEKLFDASSEVFFYED